MPAGPGSTTWWSAARSPVPPTPARSRRRSWRTSPDPDRDCLRAGRIHFAPQGRRRGMTKGYWIARVDVRDAEAYKDYVAANGAAFAKFGGRFLVRGGAHAAVMGPARSRNV